MDFRNILICNQLALIKDELLCHIFILSPTNKYMYIVYFRSWMENNLCWLSWKWRVWSNIGHYCSWSNSSRKTHVCFWGKNCMNIFHDFILASLLKIQPIGGIIYLFWRIIKAPKPPPGGGLLFLYGFVRPLSIPCHPDIYKTAFCIHLVLNILDTSINS